MASGPVRSAAGDTGARVPRASPATLGGLREGGLRRTARRRRLRAPAHLLAHAAGDLPRRERTADDRRRRRRPHGAALDDVDADAAPRALPPAPDLDARLLRGGGRAAAGARR